MKQIKTTIIGGFYTIIGGFYTIIAGFYTIIGGCYTIIGGLKSTAIIWAEPTALFVWQPAILLLLWAKLATLFADNYLLN